MQYGSGQNCIGTEAPERRSTTREKRSEKQGSARTFETIESTGSGPLTFDCRPMLAIGVPKPPLALAEDCDFEVGRLPMRCDHRSWRLKLVSRQGTNVSGWLPGKLGQMPSDVSGFEILLEGEVIVGNGSVESFKAIRARPNSLTMARLRR